MRTIKEICKDTDPTLFIDMCSLDHQKWADNVFGEVSKDFHLDFMSTVHNNRFVLIEASRGFGKTSYLGTKYPLWKAYYQPGSRFLFTASSLQTAIKILDEVKSAVESNELLRDLMPDKRDSSAWSATKLKMTNGSEFVCRAFTKTALKGLHMDYVFCDEIQDIRDRDVFYKSLTPTVVNRKGTLVVTGVPEHPADMLAELKESEEYVIKSYPVLIKDGVSRWPEKYPLDEIQRIRRRDGESTFQTQYMLNSKAEGDYDVFPASWISNCLSTDEMFGEPKYGGSTVFIGADFAISQGKRADFDCYVVVEKISGKTIIRHAERHKGLPKDAKVRRLKELHQRFKPLRMILDPSGIGTAVLQDLRNEGYPVQEGEFHARARHKMLVNLQMMMQPDRSGTSQLVIPKNKEDSAALTFANILTSELLGFKEKKSEATGILTYSSNAPHDDTVASLALACKASAEQRDFVDCIAF